VVSLPHALPLETSKAVHRCQDAVLDDGSKRHGVGLAVKPSVRISLDLARIAEPKINLANGVARSKVATPRARMKPKAAITRRVTGTRNAFVPCASPLPAHPLTNLAAYLPPNIVAVRGSENKATAAVPMTAASTKDASRTFDLTITDAPSSGAI
jgi:hypothetical protein